MTLGQRPTAADDEARSDCSWPTPATTMSCYACHTRGTRAASAATSRSGPTSASRCSTTKGITTRNYTNYNYQTLRDDVYMLGVDSTVKDHKIVPIRSACAVLVSSPGRQPRTGSTPSSRRSRPRASRARRSAPTSRTRSARPRPSSAPIATSSQGQNGRQQRDHGPAPAAGDQLGQLHRPLRLGGRGRRRPGGRRRHRARRAAGGHRLDACTSWPIPTTSRKHVKPAAKLDEALRAHGDGAGRAAPRRIPLRRLRRRRVHRLRRGQHRQQGLQRADHHRPGLAARPAVLRPQQVRHQHLLASTLALDPTRSRWRDAEPDGRPTSPNDEGKITEIGDPERCWKHEAIHPLYAFLYLTDREEGLIVIGNPLTTVRTSPASPRCSTATRDNNFLERAARPSTPAACSRAPATSTCTARYAYICCDAGLVVVDLNDPLHPRVVDTPQLAEPEPPAAGRSSSSATASSATTTA